MLGVAFMMQLLGLSCKLVGILCCHSWCIHSLHCCEFYIHFNVWLHPRITYGIWLFGKCHCI